MRRFWLLGLAVLCWILVLLVPATRRGLVREWSGSKNNSTIKTESVVVAPGLYLVLSGENASMVKRYPRNREVLVYAARRLGAEAHNMEVLGQLYPRDAYVVALQLPLAMEGLTSARVPGSLSNPNYPAAPPQVNLAKVSPPEEWQKVIDLARRGQALQPNNTYFDWCLLYGLYGSERDDEARRVLAQAVKKTEYNAFQREGVLNAVAFKRLKYGSPLPFQEVLAALGENFSTAGGGHRRMARWAMESALADRKAGRHDRAIDAAFHLAQLSEIMQRGGYSYIDYLIAYACEGIAFQSLDERIKNGVSTGPSLRPNAPLALFRSHPRSLYLYAKQQGRSELLPALDARWTERARWFVSMSKVGSRREPAFSLVDMAVLAVGERLRSLIVRALPSIVIVGVVFWLLSRRFREKVGTKGKAAPAAWRRGTTLGVLLLLLALGLDAITVTAARSSGAIIDWRYSYLGDALLERAPGWVSYGLTGAMFCFALSAAVAWQKREGGEKRGVRQGLRETFQGADDGLSSFDFGWLFSWVARLTFWLVLLGSLVWLAVVQYEMYASLRALLPPVAVLLSFLLHAQVWSRRGYRRQTVRTSLRLVAESMGGFFVVASVLYAVSAFVLLPKAWQFDRDFEAAIGQGELKLMRAKAGLYLLDS